MAVVCLSGAATWYGINAKLPSLRSAGMTAPAPTVAVSSEDYTRRQPGRPLFAGLSSYSSIDQITRDFAARKLVPVRRTMSRPPDPRYPVHALDLLTLEHYSMLGTQGRLSLQFFNDRLFEVGFKPDDAAACAAALKRADPQLRRDANGRAERTVGSQRLATNVELAASSVGQSLNTEPYVLWQDLRLVRERDDWDQRFGAIVQKTEQ
ncbi:MAG: hypothetical protein JWQ90_4570 [Hydrocarboniphaga sp.]|uniref:hypothetical protein n=1 Tax=Hydrocarboniphaga sp. TaxID=2033016 RepID=UPI0026168131|nr:hypothetical protein [Hydrocarboniphaga sp.]MDB5972120.1 hypothetical protein [Hydrocarboniphaga sp.]